jgi:DNA (cytosine-5)-methyltransferase 1
MLGVGASHTLYASVAWRLGVHSHNAVYGLNVSKLAYYNENDAFAAEWLRRLIAGGHIAPGDVDERDVRDVKPSDLGGYAQCHFFAGVGVWSYALRQAGWKDNASIWTGSCPCQPFSAAGKGGGFADERHLWPAFHHLIRAHGPELVIGEQVASKDGLDWLDLVQTDMEEAGYAFGALDTCAAGFGAPHWRQRLYWVAVSAIEGSQGRVSRPGAVSGARRRRAPERSGCDVRVADANNRQRDRIADGEGRERDGEARGRIESNGQPKSGGDAIGLDNSPSARRARPIGNAESEARHEARLRVSGEASRFGELGASGRPGPLNGLWRDADWLYCRDGKWRPVEPGSFPLVNGAAARVGRLRGYGNAIVAPQAAEFCKVVREIIE